MHHQSLHEIPNMFDPLIFSTSNCTTMFRLMRLKWARTSVSWLHVKQSDSSNLRMCISWKIASGKTASTVGAVSGFPFSFTSSKSCEFISCRMEKSLSWLCERSSFFSKSGNTPYFSLMLFRASNRIFSDDNCEKVSNSKSLSWLSDKSISSSFIWNVLSNVLMGLTIIFLNVSFPMAVIWLLPKITRRRLMAP